MANPSLSQRFAELRSLPPTAGKKEKQERGFAFEKLLRDLFEAAGRLLRLGGPSKFTRSPVFRTAGHMVPFAGAPFEFVNERCAGNGNIRAGHRAVFSTAAGAGASTVAGMACAAPAVATAGGAVPLCIGVVAGSGVLGGYAGRRFSDATWRLGTSIGNGLYDLFGS